MSTAEPAALGRLVPSSLSFYSVRLPLEVKPDTGVKCPAIAWQEGRLAHG